ncbi:MAG: acyl-CoA synthetase, partial [Chromatiales bacterium]|nr:acyl-CoA synthetase [Chromatiales bacterium]
RPTEDVVLLGNGGGASVLATDAFSKAGIEVRPLPQAARDALTKLKLPDGASVANPVDIPANVMQREGGNVARTLVQQIFAHTAPGAFVIHINVPVVLGYTHLDLLGILTSATLEASANSESQSHVALVLRSDGAPEVEAAKAVLRTRALELGIAVFNEVDEAAMALGAVARFETL